MSQYNYKKKLTDLLTLKTADKRAITCHFYGGEPRVARFPGFNQF